jgi:hypothetical protein
MPARLESSILSNPFAGRSNIRLSSVHCWIPGLGVIGRGATTGQGRLQVELIHMGPESIVDPENNVWMFKHQPLHMSTEYNWRLVMTADHAGLKNTSVSSQSMALDGKYLTVNGLQNPIRPFAKWRVTVRESSNRQLDFSRIQDAYLEFTGSYMPLKRE